MEVALPVGMGVASCGPSYSPYRVEEAKPYEGPGSPSPPRGFEPLQAGKGKAEPDPYHSQHHRADDVTHATEGGDEKGLLLGPGSYPGHGHKRQIVVGAEKGVKEPDG